MMDVCWANIPYSSTSSVESKLALLTSLFSLFLSLPMFSADAISVLHVMKNHSLLSRCIQL